MLHAKNMNFPLNMIYNIINIPFEMCKTKETQIFVVCYNKVFRNLLMWQLIQLIQLIQWPKSRVIQVELRKFLIEINQSNNAPFLWHSQWRHFWKWTSKLSYFSYFPRDKVFHCVSLLKGLLKSSWYLSTPLFHSRPFPFVQRPPLKL